MLGGREKYGREAFPAGLVAGAPRAKLLWSAAINTSLAAVGAAQLPDSSGCDMVRNIFIGLVVIAALAVGGAFLLPQKVHVERSTVIAAAPDEIYAVVSDLTRAREWGPWYKRDPNMQVSVDGPPNAVGGKLSWKSETQGSGTQEIVELVENKSVKTKLDFGDQGTATAAIDLNVVEGGTNVTWSMDTDTGMNPVMRYMGLMFDSWVGKDYEEGLANLKALVEAQAKASTNEALATPGSATPPDLPMADGADPTQGPHIVTVEGRPAILTRAKAKASDSTAVSAALGAANQKLLTYGMTHEIVPSGAPMAITIAHDAAGDWVFDAALPLDAKPDKALPEQDGVKIGDTYGGRAVKLTHKGGYDTLRATHDKIHAYTKANNLKEKGVAWEEYVTDPSETPDEEMLTNVYVAIE